MQTGFKTKTQLQVLQNKPCSLTKSSVCTLYASEPDKGNSAHCQELFAQKIALLMEKNTVRSSMDEKKFAKICVIAYYLNKYNVSIFDTHIRTITI